MRSPAARPRAPQRRMILSLLLAAASAKNAIDEYVEMPEPAFKWFDTGARVKTLGGTAHILNVTSLQWMTTAEAIGPTGALWTHQVAVVVPNGPVRQTLALSVMTGGCNEGPPKPPAPNDEYLALAAALGNRTGAIAVVIYQIPNCHIVYPSDPRKMPRDEDAMIAWAWNQFLTRPEHNPLWLPRFPMVKAGFQCMKAVEQYTAKSGLASIDGWAVGGASKRGWTTWMVGATECASCVTIRALFPLVPIVPNLLQSVHLQRQSLGGLTFAFRDYLDADINKYMDLPIFDLLLDYVDPVSPRYAKQLARLPKFAICSSDDEFMQFDWTALNNSWTTAMPGESHLLIAPNSEHSLATAIPEVLESVLAFVDSVASGAPTTARPTFSVLKDEVTGTITVTVPTGAPVPSKVYFRTGQTASERRDFRWVRMANNETGECSVAHGEVPLAPMEGGGNCLVPRFWAKDALEPHRSSQGAFTYTATPPMPTKPGHFVGYYMELFFPSLAAHASYMFSTPGYVWPDTLPFPDCNLSTCPANLL